MDGKVVIGTTIDTKEFDAQINYIESRMLDIEDLLKQADMGFEVGDIEKLESEYEKLGNQLIGLKEKQEKYNKALNEASKQGFESLSNQISKVGKSTEKNIKKVTKWGLALFGIRTAYMFIRSAVNQLAETDPQLKADLDYMKNVLIYTIEPVIKRLVEWLRNALLYVGYLIKAWTGKDIFANANKQLNKANKKAKELKKTLSGFDEANILQDNKAGDTGGANGQLSLGDMEPPKWLQWIKDNGEVVAGLLGGIATAIASVKLGLGLLAGLLNAGIFVQAFLVFYNYYSTLKGIVEWIKDPSWDKFYNIIEHAIKSTGILGYGLVEIFRMVFKNGEDLKRFFSSLWSGLKTYYLNFYDGFKTVIENVKRLFKGIYNFLTGVFSGDWERAWKGLKDIVCSVFNLIANAVRTPLQAIVNMINAVIKGLNSLSIKIPDWVPAYGGKKFDVKIPKIPDLPKLALAKGGIVNLPSRGIPIGNAIAGERGAEGVIPLTDSQKMAILGEAIGRYITVNNVVENYMDSRRINRVLQQSRGSDMLANNGGGN